MEDNKEIKLDSFYKYGIVTGKTIMLFNETEHSSSVLGSDFLNDVTVCFNEQNGLLKISGQRVKYDYYAPGVSYFGRVFEDKWDEEPHQKLIRTGKRHFWSKIKERYVDSGWIRTTKTSSYTLIASIDNFNIEVFD